MCASWLFDASYVPIHADPPGGWLAGFAAVLAAVLVAFLVAVLAVFLVAACLSLAAAGLLLALMLRFGLKSILLLTRGPICIVLMFSRRPSPRSTCVKGQ